MNKRKLLISSIGVGVLVLSIIASRFLQKPVTEIGPSQGQIATAVNAVDVEPDSVTRYIKITGRLVPKHTVNIFAEVGGIAQFGNKPFKAGVRYNKGEVLLQINSEEIESSLAAARSGFQSQLAGALPDIKLDFPDALPAWESYLYKLKINESLPPLPEVKDQKLKMFMSGRNIITTYYNIREAETRLGKYTITAPFTGTLIEAQADASSLVRTGQSLGTFISTGDYELEAGVSYTDAAALQVGEVISMQDVNTGKTYNARVVRINDAVNIQTQQVVIFAEVNDPGAKSGIYLEGKAPVQTYKEAIDIPVKALVNEKSIYLIRDSAAVLIPVEVLYKDAERAIVTGIKNREKLINDSHNEAFAGSKVSIVNITP